MKLWKNSHFAAVCLAAAFTTLPSNVLAQLSDLPVKSGLWQTHVNTKAGPTDLSADDKYCFTAGTTLSDYLTATYKPMPGTTCKVSNKTQTAHGISYDTACTGGSAGSNGHIDFQLPDAEHFSGTSQTKVTGTAGGKPLNMEVDKTFTAKFVASACGDVKPLVVPSNNGK
jgi:hypothetical protein